MRLHRFSFADLYRFCLTLKNFIILGYKSRSTVLLIINVLTKITYISSAINNDKSILWNKQVSNYYENLFFITIGHNEIVFKSKLNRNNAYQSRDVCSAHT